MNANETTKPTDIIERPDPQDLHWRRALAGLRSLADRGELSVTVGRVGPAAKCHIGYTDTDRLIEVYVGDREGDAGRCAAYDGRSGLEGDLVLHRTGSNRAEWCLADDTIIYVQASGRVRETITVPPPGEPEGDIPIWEEGAWYSGTLAHIREQIEMEPTTISGTGSRGYECWGAIPYGDGMWPDNPTPLDYDRLVTVHTLDVLCTRVAERIALEHAAMQFEEKPTTTIRYETKTDQIDEDLIAALRTAAGGSDHGVSDLSRNIIEGAIRLIRGMHLLPSRKSEDQSDKK